MRLISLLSLSYVSPMKRLMENTVLTGLVIACRLAGSPTRRSPFSTNATIEGVVRFPSLLGITTGSLPSITATHEFVVPKSIPIIFPIVFYVFRYYYFYQKSTLNINDYAMRRFEKIIRKYDTDKLKTAGMCRKPGDKTAEFFVLNNISIVVMKNAPDDVKVI